MSERSTVLPPAEGLRAEVRATLMPGFPGLEAPEWIRDALRDGLHSVCIYGENVRDADQLRALGRSLREARPDALVAIDEEGGEVTRLHYVDGAPYPGPRSSAASTTSTTRPRSAPGSPARCAAPAPRSCSLPTPT
ncbi:MULTISPECIES: hypothetical protein [unclassified Leucobacter]|uniref:hypothetical protein n=1 Tax=unclassified Leucobacter TaxID=2621730 RepID=UPI000AF38F41|nr:hypothetical protein [Leucobacter sp. Ag1]